MNRLHKTVGFGVILMISYPLTRLTLQPPWKNYQPRPEKTVIITGATEPVGKATVFEYAKRKCRIIMACPDLDECRAFRREVILESRNKSLVCRHLDMEDIDSINKFVDEIVETEPHIDILINNATLKVTSGQVMSKYGIERHFFANFLATYLLTLRLLPKLEESAREQRDSRIINMVGRPKKSWSVKLDDINFEKRDYSHKCAYEQSKLAIAYFTIVLNQILREKNSRIYVFGNGHYTQKTFDPYEYKSSEWMRALDRYKALPYNHPETFTGPSVMCGLDDRLTVDDSGNLYKFFLSSYGRHKGWGVAGDDNIKAKLVWNYAANLLSNFPQQSPGNSHQGDSSIVSEDQSLERGG